MLQATAALGLALGLVGCTSPSNTDSLREHTADVTAAAKRNADAIAHGIAEGLARKGPLDLNKASVRQLAALPGISNETAQTIVDQRPYTVPKDLVRRKIMTAAQFNRIKAQVMVDTPPAAN